MVFDEANTLLTWNTTDVWGDLLSEWDAATGAARDALLGNLGTNQGWFDAAGGVTWTPRDSFGNPTGPVSDSEPHALTWHSQDPTGLVYAQARYLDTVTGRFISEDPVVNGNLYSYAQNDPINVWDPYGAVAAVDYGTVTSTTSQPVIPCWALTGIRIACVLWTVADMVGLLEQHLIVHIIVEVGCTAAAGAKGCFTEGTQVLVGAGDVAIGAIDPGGTVLAQSSEPDDWLGVAWEEVSSSEDPKREVSEGVSDVE